MPSSGDVEKSIKVSIVVYDSKMFLRLVTGSETVDLPFHEAKRLVKFLDSIVPYRYGHYIWFKGLLQFGSDSPGEHKFVECPRCLKSCDREKMDQCEVCFRRVCYACCKLWYVSNSVRCNTCAKDPDVLRAEGKREIGTERKEQKS